MVIDSSTFMKVLCPAIYQTFCFEFVHGRFRMDSSKDMTSGFSHFISTDVWYRTLEPLAHREGPWQC